MGRGRVKLTEVNPHLVCVLCRGYLIDATTITECLHSFCRSCIILYLERKSYCPICEVQIHKTKPYLNLKLDKTLQDIVYKLVPGLFHNEMRRRQEFYKSHPLHDRHLHPEARGIAIDRLIYSPDDSISLSLEYYDKQREREEWTSVGDTSTVATHGAEGKRYLLCPAVVTMAHLKKFLRSKYNLPDSASVEVLYRRESLPDSYSLMDVAYIYTWKQNEPMRFYYRIHLLTKCIRSLPELESIKSLEKQSEVKDSKEEETSKLFIDSYKDFISNKTNFIKKLNVAVDEHKKSPDSSLVNRNLLISKNKSQQTSTENGLVPSPLSLRNGISQKHCLVKTTSNESVNNSDSKSSIVPVNSSVPVDTSNFQETNINKNVVSSSSTYLNEELKILTHENQQKEPPLKDMVSSVTYNKTINQTKFHKEECSAVQLNQNVSSGSQISEERERKSHKLPLPATSQSVDTSKEVNITSKGSLPTRSVLPQSNISSLSDSINDHSLYSMSQKINSKPIQRDYSKAPSALEQMTSKINFSQSNEKFDGLLSKDSLQLEPQKINSKSIQREKSKVSFTGKITCKINLAQKSETLDGVLNKATPKHNSPVAPKHSSLSKTGNQKMNFDCNPLAASKRFASDHSNVSQKNICSEGSIKPSTALNSFSTTLLDAHLNTKHKTPNSKSPSKTSIERLPVLKTTTTTHTTKVSQNTVPEGNLKPSADLKTLSHSLIDKETRLKKEITNKNGPNVKSESNYSTNIQNKKSSSNQPVVQQSLESNGTVTELDESSSALLTAIGLQPISKTSPIKTPDNAIENCSKSSPGNTNENSKESDLSKTEGNTNNFPVRAFSPLKPFRSEHDEMSVSLLLGLSNGHVEKQLGKEQMTDKRNNGTPELPTRDLQTVTNNDKKSDASSSTNSPIKNIQKVVNKIVPLSKNTFNASQNRLSRENKNDFQEKNLLDKNLHCGKINGFKVPQNPVYSETLSISDTRKVPGPKILPMKNSAATKEKIYNSDHELQSGEKAKYVTENSSLVTCNRTSSQSPVGRTFPCTKSPPLKDLPVADKDKFASKPTKHVSSSRVNTLSDKKDIQLSSEAHNSKFDNNTIDQVNSPAAVFSNAVNKKGDDKNACVSVESSNSVKSSSEFAKGETFGKEFKTENLSSSEDSTPVGSESDVKSSETTSESVIDAAPTDSKVNLLKRKLNAQPNECDVIVSAATRDDSLTEAKKRKQVTPDVSIELLSGPLNDRSSVKRPLFEYPCLTKKLGSEKNSIKSVKSNEGTHTEIRISKFDQLCASSVKIEKVSSSQINNINARTVNKERHALIADSTKSIDSSPEPLQSCKSDFSETRISEDSVTPDITIEKMKESPKVLPKKTIENNCEVKVTKVTDVSSVKSQCTTVNKRKSDSPLSFSDPESPSSSKKMPRLIEINAPPRPKLDPTFQERKNQRTGLKMTTVRKEVPIGKEVPLVRKDCNGALDLSGKNTAKPALPARVSPSEMFPAAAFHQFYRQLDNYRQLELHSRLLASHANNNLGRDWRKDLQTNHIEDWVRNAVTSGALPPLPLMYNPALAPPSPHRK